MLFKKISTIIALGFIIVFIVGTVSAQSQPPADPAQIVNFLKIFFPGGTAGEAATSNAPNAPASQSAPPTATSVKTFRELFNEIGGKMGIPPRLLEGVLVIEHGDYLLNFTSDQVNAYSAVGAVIPKCGPNNCSAAGAMQMTIGVDDRGSSVCAHCGSGLTQCPNMWGAYGRSVNTNGGYTHAPNPCNLRDNIYAAAAKIKSDSGNTGGAWTREQVFSVGLHYYGSCSERFAHLNDKSYCEFLWWYYGKE